MSLISWLNENSGAITALAAIATVVVTGVLVYISHGCTFA